MAVYDLGDQVELTIYVTTDAGVAATATVTCTITLPDGTTTSPSVTTSATGTYEITYAPSQAGTHYVRWVADAIGGVAVEDDVFEDTFTVSESNNTFLSLAEAKEYLNLNDTADDDELLAYTETACHLAELVADRTFSRKTQVDTLSSTGDSTTLYLTRRPVISITSVTERGTTLASTAYSCDLTYGHLYRMASTYDRTYWAQGSRSNVVTYVAGYAIIPTDVRYATLQILEHLWQNQRTTFASGVLASDGGIEFAAEAGRTWNIPHKARDILLDYRRPGIG